MIDHLSMAVPTDAPARQSRKDRRVELVAARGASALSVHSISATEVTGRTSLGLKAGDLVSVIFEEQQRQQGAVRWARAKLVGIAFAAPLSQTLVQGSPSGRPITREPRYDIARHAAIYHNGSIFDGLIRNVSRHGMLIDTLPGLVPGQEIRIGCGSSPILSAVVRWVQHGQAGLRLTQPLDLTDFEARTAPFRPGG